jgi:hypothetical protein
MEKKTLTIVIIITTLLCGLPGLCGLCFGSMAIFGSFVPDASGNPPQDAALVVGIGITMVGLSLVFIAIPIGIGVWNWWSKKPKIISMDEILIPEDDF